LRTSRDKDGKEKFECRGGYGSLDEMCSKIQGAHVREDRGRWCGCNDDHHHMEYNGNEHGKDTWICMRDDVHSPKDCDKGKEIPLRWKRDHDHEEWKCIPMPHTDSW